MRLRAAVRQRSWGTSQLEHDHATCMQLLILPSLVCHCIQTLLPLRIFSQTCTNARGSRQLRRRHLQAEKGGDVDWTPMMHAGAHSNAHAATSLLLAWLMCIAACP